MQSQTSSSIAGDVWQASGSSEHMGGADATRRLLEMCAVFDGQRVLDIGCGAGHTLNLLAQEYGVRVTGVDLSMQLLRRARLHGTQSDQAERAQLINADGGNLPLSTGAFDCAIVESILVHADAEQILAEAYRVLAPGGRLGANEMTYIKPPPVELIHLLEQQIGIRAYQPEGWEEVFERVGFRSVATETRPFSLWDQLKGHLTQEGIRGYLVALRKGLSNRRLRGAFLNREMLSVARRFSKAVGYGLYVVEKPPV